MAAKKQGKKSKRKHKFCHNEERQLDKKGKLKLPNHVVKNIANE